MLVVGLSCYVHCLFLLGICHLDKETFMRYEHV